MDNKWKIDVKLQNNCTYNKTYLQAVILGHVPPGQFEKHETKKWFDDIHNRMFVRLLQKYSKIISAVHMAHHHTDSFKIIRALGLFFSPSLFYLCFSLCFLFLSLIWKKFHSFCSLLFLLWFFFYVHF